MSHLPVPRSAGIAVGLALVALALLPGGAAAQELSLRDALARADASAYANRMASGESATAAGAALAPYRGILPSLRVESGYLRTTDPLNAFGFTLRQRSVTPAAFAPSSLNQPDAIGNLMTGVVLEQPLFNADAWLGRAAARRAAQASVAQERWTHASTAVLVVRAYWGAVLAQEQERMLQAALAAAQSHQRQAEALVRQGMATRSDGLLASVKAGEVESMLLGAGNQARIAARELALLMGDPAATDFTLPAALPAADAIRLLSGAALEDSAGSGQRADVEAARLASTAAGLDARRATALYLPRLNGFGRLEWNDANTPFGGGSAWTVGVMLSWSPFAGASEIAEVRAARGRRTTADAMAEAAKAQADLEQVRAGDAVPLALARMEIAGRGVSQAIEAHRIVGRKYDGGLATVTELLDAAAVKTAAELNDVFTRYEAIVALAEQRKAQGLDQSPLQALQP